VCLAGRLRGGAGREKGKGGKGRRKGVMWDAYLQSWAGKHTSQGRDGWGEQGPQSHLFETTSQRRRVDDKKPVSLVKTSGAEFRGERGRRKTRGLRLATKGVSKSHRF